MAAIYRRGIIRTVQTDESAWAELTEKLQAAVERQNELANACPHVLRFKGSLQAAADNQSLVIEHEPATTIPIGPLFSDSSAPVPAAHLLRVTAALYEALAAAHGGSGGAPLAHGCICPGVVLYTPDGQVKVSDFGFAQAICSVLGPQEYLNLAVGPTSQDVPSGTTFCMWEVQAPDEFSRDDRICGFVDPEKYGTHTLTAFEHGSDIIGAGFVLHLMAEHQHAYLYADPDAHRLVEMSEFMAMGRYNGARRKDLRAADDPGTKRWCDLMAGILARLPQNRPSAGEVAEALSEYVVPQQADDVLRQQLGEIEGYAQQEEWDKVLQECRLVVQDQAAPADVTQRANALAMQAEANLLLAQATESLQHGNLDQAGPPLEDISKMVGLPAELVDRARQLSDVVRANIVTRNAVEEIRAELEQADRVDPVQLHDQTETLLQRLGHFAAEDALVERVAQSIASVKKEVEAVRDEVLPHAKAAKQQNLDSAQAWVDKITSAAEAASWDEVGSLLEDRPSLTHWPEGILEKANAFEQQLDAFRADQARQGAIQEDAQSAHAWIDSLSKAVAEEDWDLAEQALADKPRLANWPDDILDQANQLASSLRNARKDQANLAHAEEWAGRFIKAAQAEDWDAATDLLAQKPVLQSWPEELADTLAPLQAEVEQRVEADELERRRVEQQQRQAYQWLDQANEASNSEQWEEALTLTQTPPALESIPKQVMERSAKLAVYCRDKLGEAVLEELRARREKILELARRHIDGLIGQEFEGLIAPGAFKVGMDADEFVSDIPGADGRAVLHVAAGETSGAKLRFSAPFDFKVNAEPASICDDEGTLDALLVDSVGRLLLDTQKQGIVGLAQRLRDGLFPMAEADLNLGKATAEADAKIQLMGPDSSAGSLKVPLRWAPDHLRWEYRDAAEFCDRATRICTREVAAQIMADLPARSDLLGQYLSLLEVKLESAPDDSRTTLAAPLPLDASLGVRGGGPLEPQTLLSFKVSCPQLGIVDHEADLSTAEATLLQLIVQAQISDRSAIEADLSGQVKGAAAKAKITSSPNRIQTPVGELTFELKPKGRPPLQLAASWDVKKFAFILPEEWQQLVDQCLAGTAPLAPIADSIETSSPDQTKKAPLWRQRRAQAAAGLIAAAGLAAGGWAVWSGPAKTVPHNPTKQPAGTEPTEDEVVKKPTAQPIDDQSQPPDTTEIEQPQVPTNDADTTRDEVITTPTDPPAEDPEDQALKELTAQLAIATKDYESIEQELKAPTHSQLVARIDQGGVDELVETTYTLSDQLPADATDLADQVDTQLEQLEDWQAKLREYGKVLDLGGKTIDEQIQVLEKAKSAWTTDWVTRLLEQLPSIGASLAAAEEQAGQGNWRSALSALRKVKEGAAEAGLATTIDDTIAAAHQRVADARLDFLTPVLAEAKQWLANNPMPENQLFHLSQTDQATEARYKLDYLDFDFPTNPESGDWIDAARQEEIFPWTILSDIQAKTVAGLLDWVNVSLPIPAINGSEGSAIDLVFIPPWPAAGLTDSVWMSQTEITVAQFQTITGSLPDARGEAFMEMRKKGTNPIAFVPADKVGKFCGQLQSRFDEGTLTVKIPDAERWKIAYHAGAYADVQAFTRQCAYDQGGTARLDPTRANLESDELFSPNELFSPGHEDGYEFYAPVRLNPSNRWLLHGMLDNVREWVRAVSRIQAVGGSFRDAALDDYTEPIGMDNSKAYDHVGLRIVIVPTRQ